MSGLGPNLDAVQQNVYFVEQEGNAIMTAARKLRKSSKSSLGDIPRQRQQFVIDTATRAGLLSGESGRIAGRVRETLIQTAKERSGISSDTALLEYALAKVALEDNFGAKILARKGRVSPDVDLEF
jgi:hypothetical protein